MLGEKNSLEKLFTATPPVVYIYIPDVFKLYYYYFFFQGLLDMNKTEFLQLPKWKRTKIKQSVGLF